MVTLRPRFQSTYLVESAFAQKFRSWVRVLLVCRGHLIFSLHL
jgi:hypothetical protein